MAYILPYIYLNSEHAIFEIFLRISYNYHLLLYHLPLVASQPQNLSLKGDLPVLWYIVRFVSGMAGRSAQTRKMSNRTQN